MHQHECVVHGSNCGCLETEWTVLAIQVLGLDNTAHRTLVHLTAKILSISFWFFLFCFKKHDSICRQSCFCSVSSGYTMCVVSDSHTTHLPLALIPLTQCSRYTLIIMLLNTPLTTLLHLCAVFYTACCSPYTTKSSTLKWHVPFVSK